MEDKQGEVYAGPIRDDNSIDVTVESASGPITGDTEGEIIETVETVETTTTRHSRHPRFSAKTKNNAPKKKKTGVIVTAIVILFVLFGCIGGGGSDTNTNTNTDNTSSNTTTEESAADNTGDNEQNTTEVDEYYSWTSEQQHAYNSGLSYLDYSAFSKQGLIDQLSSEYGEGYPVEVAEFAVNKIEERGEVDWVEQAKRSAQSYLDFSDFSKQGLIDQLSSPYGEKFTVEQATEAVEAVY